jgi:hypothetical protein
MTTLEAKFETGPAAAPNETAFDGGSIPWGYGDDRIAALVRSPDSLYVYWEITDEGIAKARKALGPAGEHGWCNLRVYDTTNVAFDGINAHSYFDVTVDRGARDYFFDLRRPASSAHVEIGIKSAEGFFVAIARSGRADFPRKGPSPNHSLEWMTVTSDDAPPAARPYQSRYVPRPAPPAPPPSAHVHTHYAGPAAPSKGIVGGGGGGGSVEERSWTWTHPVSFEVRWEGPWIFDSWRTEWRVHRLTGIAGERGELLQLGDIQWLTGPFMEHALDLSRFEVRWLGEGPTLAQEHASGLQVFGPWAVVIKSQSPEQRRTIATWRIHWTRVEPAKVERWWGEIQRVRIHAWERTRVVAGASEAHAIVEGGASEAWRIGASEKWARGASEWLALGASEVGWMGASERALGGASALLFGGASGFMFGGASGFMFGGSEGFPGSSSALFSHAPYTPEGWR